MLIRDLCASFLRVWGRTKPSILLSDRDTFPSGPGDALEKDMMPETDFVPSYRGGDPLSSGVFDLILSSDPDPRLGAVRINSQGE